MAAGMREWEVVGSVGEWGVARARYSGYRPFQPAAIVTREMLNC
jgi:hypothetical protein